MQVGATSPDSPQHQREVPRHALYRNLMAPLVERLKILDFAMNKPSRQLVLNEFESRRLPDQQPKIAGAYQTKRRHCIVENRFKTDLG
jgi:hypothetical protein